MQIYHSILYMYKSSVYLVYICYYQTDMRDCLYNTIRWRAWIKTMVSITRPSHARAREMGFFSIENNRAVVAPAGLLCNYNRPPHPVLSNVIIT